LRILGSFEKGSTLFFIFSIVRSKIERSVVLLCSGALALYKDPTKIQ